MQSIESPNELAERFWRELRELVEQGEIGPAVADRVRDDLFEPVEAGQRPRLKWSVWCSYIEGEHQLSIISELRRRLA